MRYFSILIIATALSGCMITGKTKDGLSIIKPSQAQINSAAKRIVCDSFGPIRFSARGDTAQTIKEIREFNAARASFGCE